ncbi:class I SAM-dependent methyltransferase [Cellulophaga lytica]|uniref:class I SAM-dependent methyltransferase n=1 Tax=Cellulophaga lytica TaxID=979 RepID=UPI0032E3F65B
MTDFWEKAFQEKEKMWGMGPAKSTMLTKDFFIKKGVKRVLIPGIGYGRNAKPFLEHGIEVIGIEISKRAIKLAKQYYNDKITIYHGSVHHMPFNDNKYDGIYCYALIHLLDKAERKAFIKNCFSKLNKNGIMVFTAISKKAPQFGKGKRIDENRYEVHKGVQIFYYDLKTITDEFQKYGLFDILEVQENHPMYLIKCKKE